MHFVVITTNHVSFSRPVITEDEAKDLVDTLSATKIQEEDSSTSCPLWKSSISTVGLNATLRALGKGKVNVLIISASIRPKHIVDQCIMLALGQNEGISILCVPKLNELLADSIGFCSCLCFSLSGDLTHQSFQKLMQLITLFSSRFTMPSSYIRPIASKIQPKHHGQLFQNPKKLLSPVPFDDIYVAKPPAGRNFVPTGTILQTTNNKDWSEFISFSGAVKSAVKTKEKHSLKHLQTQPSKKKNFMAYQKIHLKKTNYINLSVNRIQPNPNKVKKPKKK